MAGVLLEARPYRPFKSSEEYLYAMKEDLAEWLNILYTDLEINVDNFMDKLETGVVLCKHANSVKKSAEEYVARKQLRKMTSSQALTASLMTKSALPITKMGEIVYRLSAKPGTFFARDNVSNFIDFCRHGLEILECLLFETDDLIMRKNEKNVILCLLEVARRGAKFGMLAPILVQMEREIDREIAAEQRLARGDTEDESSEDEEELIPYGPIPQIITNDLKNLDEMVRDLVERCTCPTQFPMIRVSEGKYRIGDTKVLIFVRILRSHVMVRVGGGWDTLSHYLDKHDPCRCRTGHKAALSSKLILKSTGAIELNNAQVLYERSPPRTRRSSASSSSSGQGGRDGREYLSACPNGANRSRSPTPKREASKNGPRTQKFISTFLMEGSRQGSVSPKRGRSVSPGAPNRPSYNAPTMASRNRSRSPGMEPKKSLAKQNDVKYFVASQLNGGEGKQMRRAKVILEAKEHLNGLEDIKQNDSESEVSDEGYRSLGLVVTSPVIGEGKVVSTGMIMGANVNGSDPSAAADYLTRGSYEAKVALSNKVSKYINPLCKSFAESPTSEGSFGSNEEDHRYMDTKPSKSPKKSISLDRTHQNGTYHKSPTKIQSPSTKKPNRVNSRSSSPCGVRETQVPARRYSAVNQPDAFRRKSNKENELRKVPRSRSATPGRQNSLDSSSQPPPSKSCTVPDSKFGTWNGKSKKRSGLQSSDAYASSNFVRNGVGRSSLGSSSSGYDPVTGRRLPKSSPSSQDQKTMSPLLADLLKTKNLDDDKSILLKMREIINQYSGIFEEEPEKKYESGAEDLDFTSEWVRNNGNLRKMESGDFDEKSSPNKRKDSKYDGSQSKIPAPVFFKQTQQQQQQQQQLCEKEC